MGALEIFFFLNSALTPCQTVGIGNSFNASHSISICYPNCSQEHTMSICNKETFWKQNANTLNF